MFKCILKEMYKIYNSVSVLLFIVVYLITFIQKTRVYTIKKKKNKTF